MSTYKQLIHMPISLTYARRIRTWSYWNGDERPLHAWFCSNAEQRNIFVLLRNLGIFCDNLRSMQYLFKRELWEFLTKRSHYLLVVGGNDQPEASLGLRKFYLKVNCQSCFSYSCLSQSWNLTSASDCI